MSGLNREVTEAVECDMHTPDGAGQQLEVDGLVWAPGGQRWIYELTLTGALDLAGAPGLEAMLREAIAGGARNIYLDMAGVNFLDSAGLNILIETQSQLADLQGRLILREPSWSVRRLVCLADLCAVLGLDSGHAPCRHNGASAQHGSDGIRYPAAGPIEPDQPLRVTGVHAA
jgi:anti-anti-sigma factor